MSELKETLFQACERELNRYHSTNDVGLSGLANEYEEWKMKRLLTRKQEEEPHQ